MLTLQHNVFRWHGPFSARSYPERAGFSWSESAKCWYTPVPYIAYLLNDKMDAAATARLAPVHQNVMASMAKEPMLEIAAPEGQAYYPFQAAGIEHMTDQLRRGRKAVLCADEQGLGKTCQAIGVANELGLKKILVVCPATLRLNWARELENWHLFNKGVDPVLSGSQKVSRKGSIVTSYHLAEHVKDYQPDLVVIDEMHYLKNAGTIRSQLMLGDGDGWAGMVGKAPTILLSGTPIPNGRPSEAWPSVFRTAPEVIGYMKYWPFLRRFCIMQDQESGDTLIIGAKRTGELYARLRGSGFMTRRLKKDVLKDLPPKRYKMVVFTQNAHTSKVIEREQPFSAEEIFKHGVPVGTALPEIRREMGIAKIPQSVEYIKDILEGGTQKVVVFAHHLEPVGLLEAALAEYKPVVITGSTPPARRQEYVDRFQNDSSIRVFIGNEAAEEGITLTAAADVVMVEPEWVPGKNDQRADRLHRIGQLGSVMAHILVVEGSLDAHILGRAAKKASDISSTLDINPWKGMIP